VLLLRASEPIGGDPDGDWRPRWEVPHDTVDVPGNHLTMMDTHAETAAAAISNWLQETVDEAQARQATEGREVRA
jgi:hypothetical protein